MVHTLFLTDSRNFNPAKYTPYTVLYINNYFIPSVEFTCYVQFELAGVKKDEFFVDKNDAHVQQAINEVFAQFDLHVEEADLTYIVVTKGNQKVNMEDDVKENDVLWISKHNYEAFSQ